MAIYEIPLPNGQIVEIEGPEGKEREARLRARQYFQESDPEGFTKWNESRPLGGFGSSFVQSGRGALGSQIEGAAPYLETVGLPGQETARGIGKAISGEESLDTRGFESFTDLLKQLVNRPTEAIPAALGTAAGSVLGSVAAPVVAGLGAAALGAGAPLAAGVGLGTAIVTGAFSSTNELESLLKNEPNVDPETARRLAVGVGGLIGAGEGGAAGALISRTLGRTLRRETLEGITQMAARSGREAAARGTLAGIALEGGSEFVGGAARETTAALASGNFDVANRADRVLLDAAMGSIGGGALGAVGGMRDPARARAELTARSAYGPQLPPEGTETEEAPPPPPPSPPGFPEGYFTLPEAPPPITDTAVARDFLNQNRPDVRSIDMSDDAAVNAANYYQNLYYEDGLSKRRAGAVQDFLGAKAVREIETPGATEEEAPTVRQVRDVQADQFTRRLLEAAATPVDPADPAGPKKIDLGNFTIRQIQDLALEPFGENVGLMSSSPEQEARRNAEERSVIRRELNALRDDGFLTEGLGKNSYALAVRDWSKIEQDELRRRTATPPSPPVLTGPPDFQTETPPAPGLAGEEPPILTGRAPTTPAQTAARRADAAAALNFDAEAKLADVFKDDANARTYLGNLLTNVTKRGINFRDWQKLFRAEGVELDQPQAARVYREAVRLGVLDKLGNIPKVAPAPAPKAPAAAPPAAPPPVAAPAPTPPPAPAPKPPAPPKPKAPPPVAVDKDMWTGYEKGTGPKASDAVVTTAKAIARDRGKDFTKNEFGSFVNDMTAASKGDARAQRRARADIARKYLGQDLKAAKEELSSPVREALSQADEDLRPARETIKAEPGVNLRRMAKMLGPQLYGSIEDIGSVSVKEVLQNSYDAVKSAIANGSIEKGNIDISLRGHRISMLDNGIGMSPQTLGTKFLTIAGTGKQADERASGGFGIAKMLFLYGNEDLRVVTMQNGKVAELVTSGPALYDSLENKDAAPDIQVRSPTAQDLEMFPAGQGTFIEIKTPETYEDTQTGETKSVYGVYSAGNVAALVKSPLFADIDVIVNGNQVPNVGSDFQAQDYAQFVNAKFPWGNARIYVSKAPETFGRYDDNFIVLSNGLYQFSSAIKANPLAWGDPPLPYRFYVDVNPSVKPDEAGYPFALNRQDFTKEAKEQFAKIQNYISALYGYKELSEGASSFGNIQYIDPATGELSTPVDLTPNIPAKSTAFDGIQAGDKVEVREGKLFVNGQELPELTPNQLKDQLPKSSELKVDPSLINTDRVMVHDNVDVSEGDTVQPLSDYMRERFGTRFDDYVAEVGQTFKDLRDVVARVMSYGDLPNEAVGISFDTKYRGVSIRVPFSGSFVNPAAFESADTVEAAYGMIGTMVHELAHHQVRSHDAEFPAEMQRITYKLKADKFFDITEFEDAFAKTIENDYADVVQALYKLFNGETNANIQARGQRFGDGAAEQRQEGRSPRVSEGDGGRGGTTGAGERLLPQLETRDPNAGGRNQAGRPRSETSETGPVAYPPNTVDFAAPRLPADPAKAHKIVKQAIDQQLGKGLGGFLLKWFGSPTLTMGKVKAALQPAANLMQRLHTRTNEATNNTLDLVEQNGRLSRESVIKVTRVLERSSIDRKAPNLNGLTEEEKVAVRNTQKAFQTSLDYLIEGYVNEYFQPEGAKTVADQARLLAFQRKNTDKRLSEIPAAELRAASPEGYALFKRLNDMRNPYYFPQMTKGTHFVAAYKRGPGGKDTLVRLIPYTPLNLAQRASRQANPETAAIEALRKEFPSSTTHRIMTKGQEFTQNDRDRETQVRNQGDFIAQYLQELSQVSTKEGQKIIARMAKEIDKAQLDSIFRPNQDIMRAITPFNEGDYLLEAVPQYLLSVAKVQARRYSQADWARALEGLSPSDKAFLNDLRDYATTPTEAFGAARGAAFFMYLGGALDTALVNLTQPFQTTLPMLIRDGGLGMLKHFGSALKTVFLNRDIGKTLKGELAFTNEVIGKILNKDEANALIKARDMGVFTPLFTNESRGQFSGTDLQKLGMSPSTAFRVSKNLNWGTNFAGKFMQAVEEANRLATFLAAYRAAKADPKIMDVSNRVDNTKINNPYDYAMNKVFDTQFLTSKEDRAYIQRFTPAAEVATQFMSYPLKMIEQYVRHGARAIEAMKDGDLVTARASAVGLIAMAAPLIMLAGIWGLPGADFTKELLERLVGKLWGSAQNFDADMRQGLGGGRFAEAMVRGLPQALGIAGLSRRTSIDPVPFDDLISGSTIGLFGPVGSLAETYLSRVPQYYSNGDYWNMAAIMLPRAVGNVVRGINLEANGEQRTLRGNRIITPEMVKQYDDNSLLGRASVRQAIGFPPPEFINYREAVTRAEEVSRQVREPTTQANKELAGYLTRAMDRRQAGDMEGAARQMERFQRRIMEIVRENEGRPLDRMINLNMNSIRQRAMNDFYGIGNEAVLLRQAPRMARPEVQRQTELLLWRERQRPE